MYINMPEPLQYMLASMLSLAEHEQEQLISLSYCGSRPDYPEKILNLKWGLVGNWKIVSLIEAFGEEEGFKMFCDVLNFFSTTSDYAQRKEELSWLYQLAHSKGSKCSVDGKNFDEGVQNLFKKLSRLDAVKIEGVEQELFVPSIIVQCTDLDCGFYKGFLYVAEEKTFKHLSWPKETPNYVKLFLKAKEKLATVK